MEIPEPKPGQKNELVEKSQGQAPRYGPARNQRAPKRRFENAVPKREKAIRRDTGIQKPEKLAVSIRAEPLECVHGQFKSLHYPDQGKAKPLATNAAGFQGEPTLTGTGRFERGGPRPQP